MAAHNHGPERRVNGELLGRYEGQHVTLLGEVVEAHGTTTSLVVLAAVRLSLHNGGGGRHYSPARNLAHDSFVVHAAYIFAYAMLPLLMQDKRNVSVTVPEGTNLAVK
jgi:hypothetical protein